MLFRKEREMAKMAFTNVTNTEVVPGVRLVFRMTQAHNLSTI
jgi:phosphatidate phosphatase APP1